jgi:hypothetical protein
MIRALMTLVAAAVTFVGGAPCRSATIFSDSGSYGTDFFQLGYSENLDHGSYLLNFHTSTAVDNFDSSIYSILHYELIQYGVVFEANEQFYDDQLNYVGNNTYRHLTGSGPIVTNDGNGIYFVVTGYDCCDIYVDFTSPSNGNYTFNITSAPEPKTWAVMLFGFGIIGAFMRKYHILHLRNDIRF